jgi:hypothetical protein
MNERLPSAWTESLEILRKGCDTKYFGLYKRQFVRWKSSVIRHSDEQLIFIRSASRSLPRGITLVDRQDNT